MGEPIRSDLVRLNLGCGFRKWDDFTNVDLANNWSDTQPDVVADITQRLPFPDHYADEIHAIHVVEHFRRSQIVDILTDWKRVLKPNGKLVLELPCLDKIAKWMANPPENYDDYLRLTLIGLYGEWWHTDEMMHQWCYSTKEIKGVLGQSGFTMGNIIEPLYHVKQRDMRVVAR